jgi:hypothetical protein
MIMFVMRKKFGLGLSCAAACDGDAPGWSLLAASTRDLRALHRRRKRTRPIDFSAHHSSADHYYEPLPQETGAAG